ncbi:MAG: hypothetical protein LBS57_13595 [Treponema sp.]|jgi:hypothetical protein|nr:hypothetical protein [Treponema sp.]
MADYIPSNDAEFDRFYKFMCQYVNAKCNPPDAPQWGFIPDTARTALNDGYTAWQAAYAATLGPHTPVDTEAKNNAKKAAKAVIRPFVNQYLRFPPVLNEDRTAMGIPNRDTIPTPVPRPTVQPEADVAYPGVHLIELNHIRTVGAGKDDSRSEFGVRIFWGIMGPPSLLDKFRLTAPPATGNDLPHSTFTHRKRYLFNFEGDSGSTVYFCLRYENEKGGEEGEGPFGPILSAIIP